MVACSNPNPESRQHPQRSGRVLTYTHHKPHSLTVYLPPHPRFGRQARYAHVAPHALCRQVHTTHTTEDILEYQGFSEPLVLYAGGKVFEATPRRQGDAPVVQRITGVFPLIYCDVLCFFSVKPTTYGSNPTQFTS